MPSALIVEDEPEANRLLGLILQLRGYRSKPALTGAEALEALKEFRPDVLFLDLMLPDTNGYEICRRLKSDGATCMIPVVVVTARLAEENRTRCLQNGAQGFVPKPYTPDQIFQALSHAEAWRHELETHGTTGRFRLDSDEDELARSLTRLRCSLLANTPMLEDEVSPVIRTLRSIGQGARSWAQRNSVEGAAEVTYRIEPTRLVVAIRDCSGWFARGDFTEASAGYEPPLHAVFSRIERVEATGEVLLERDFTERGEATA